MNNIRKISLIALAVAINIVGSKIALVFSLPIFLDSIGTMLAGIAFGPVAGALAALVGGLVNGALGDIYAIYFSLSGILMGILAGLLFHEKKTTISSIIWKCFIVVLPASALSACIETFLFGGITSAAVTTFIVQALSQTALKLFGGAFLTQLVTDYIDKFIAIVLVVECLKRLPDEIRLQLFPVVNE
ncbi:ECF transporter S component [Pseudobutyrivibrio xylanivorans]|uniref:ECF transporter S component n=1 Tax=Pseudobutyrivibrio xylanivorans TaxID=185007 RepID=A0A5P6VP01_PSEXY|nr:ECF transporter S component [Pseudobutyrivibrio xylanivorans]QFJ54297.1 ECF transporter S component [Pseudobutyrivibrio xylanivorans]